MSKELKIGIFIAIALFIVAVAVFIVGDISVLFRKPGYSLFVSYESATGLEKRAVLRMAGVKVGYVKDIRLKGRMAEVELNVDYGISVPKGSRATMASIGLLGEKHIEILPSAAEEPCQPGDTLSGVPPVSFDQMGTTILAIGEEFKGIAQIISEMIGGEESKSSFRDTLNNLSSLSKDLKDTFGTYKGEIKQGLESSNQAIRKFDESVDGVSQSLDELIVMIKDAVSESKENVNVNLEAIKKLIENIEKSLELLNESLEKINKGEGTLGKLIQQPELYERAKGAMDDLENIIDPISEFKVSGGLRAEYYIENEELKGYFTLGLWPAKDKFFLAQIIYDPWREEEGLLYSAQGGLRWGNFSPRIGIMESKVGAGVDYYAIKDRVVFSLEAYDFFRDSQPHFRLRTSFAPLKHLYLILGLDDFTLSSNREAFFGLEFGF